MDSEEKVNTVVDAGTDQRQGTDQIERLSNRPHDCCSPTSRLLNLAAGPTPAVRHFAAGFAADHTKMTIIPIIATTAMHIATTAHHPAACHSAPAATPPTLPPM
jgi:hypothetical protein